MRLDALFGDGLQVRPIDRRGFLRYGMFGAASAAFATIGGTKNACAAAKPFREKAAILFFLAGGPSHIDTYDMKPDAVEQVRGPFRPIATNVSGLEVCELVPHHARIANQYSIIRSISHNLAVHDDATHWVQTGYPLLNARARGQTHPAQGAVVASLRGLGEAGLPPYVCVPEDYRTHAGFYEGPAFLGRRYLPLNAGGDPSLGNYRPPEFHPPEGMTLPRLNDRQALLASLDKLAVHAEQVSQWKELSDAQRDALTLTTSAQARQAFDLSREPEAVRERYGNHAYGQSALLARRLVEAGVSFVVINLYEKDIDWWDDHYTIEKNLRKRLPVYDQALSTLIEDLGERGLLGRTLVGAFGEFGRAPYVVSGGGREHWPRAMSALLCGAGLRGGQVVGSTTSDGGLPHDRPLKPGDLLATIYHAIGIDPQTTVRDLQNRPIPILPEGEPIRELI